MRRLNQAFLVLGTAALVWLVWYVGPAALWRGLRGIGWWGFAVVCGLNALAQVTTGATLRLFTGEPGARVPLPLFVQAQLAGHAINTVSPGGTIGEVTKFTMLVGAIPPRTLTAGLIAQNLINFIVAVTFTGIVTIATTMLVDVGGALATTLALIGGGLVLLGLLLFLVLRGGVGRWPFAVARALRVPARLVARAQAWWVDVESAMRAHGHDWRVMAKAWSLAAMTRLLYLAEHTSAYLFLGVPWQLAFMGAAVTQLVYWATAFVPMQIGAAEGGGWLFFGAVSASPEVGLVAALVMKLRRVVFVVTGLLVLAYHARLNQGPGSSEMKPRTPSPTP